MMNLSRKNPNQEIDDKNQKFLFAVQNCFLFLQPENNGEVAQLVRAHDS